MADCDDTIYVSDYNEEGYHAGAGATGKCYMRQRENSPKWVGVIFDLCCDGDEQGTCWSA